MRRFFSPNWLGLHTLTVTLIVSFLGFGYWQLTRAEGGNARSWGYTFEWPLFATFVVFMWAKMIYDELHPEKGRSVPGKPFAAVPQLDPVSAEATAGVGGAIEPARYSAARDEVLAQAEAEDPQIAAYNRYLARLNAGE